MKTKDEIIAEIEDRVAARNAMQILSEQGYDFPNLTKGSEKQIAWAEKIREKAFVLRAKAIEQMLIKADRGVAVQNLPAKYQVLLHNSNLHHMSRAMLIEALQNGQMADWLTDDAKWWIDNRDKLN